MPPPPVFTVSRVEVYSSRRLMDDSRALITSAHVLVARSHQALARQSYLRIVCAWCQETIRFQRAAGAVWGQISHSICYDCFAHVFWELAPGTTPPPLPPQSTAGDRLRPGLARREDPRRTGATDPMADHVGHRGRLALPADAPLTPCTLHEVKALP